MEEPSIVDVQHAFAALVEFTRALANRDEPALARLTFPATIVRNGLRPGALAEGWLGTDVQGVREVLATGAYGFSGTARILPDGVVAFAIVPSWPGKLPGMALIDTPRPAWPLALIRGEGGRWQVWGYPDPEEWQNGRLVELPPPPTGPVV